jgi:hypothetical protein
MELESPGLISGGLRFLSPPQRPELLSQEVKRPECEADHLHPSSAEVKNEEAILPLPHTSSWHNAQLIKHGNQFTFILVI